MLVHADLMITLTFRLGFHVIQTQRNEGWNKYILFILTLRVKLTWIHINIENEVFNGQKLQDKQSQTDRRRRTDRPE